MRLFFGIVIVVLLAGCSRPSSVPDKVMRHASDGVYAAAISSNSKIGVVSSINEGISVWDLTTDELKLQWSHVAEGDPVEGQNVVANIHIAHDNSYVVTSDREAFALWNLSSGEPEGFWRIDESSIRDIAVSNDGRGILVGRGNGKVMFFEHRTGRRLEFLGHQEKINSIALSPNGFYALSGGNDYVAYLWDTRSGQVIHRFNHSSRVTKVALDPQGRFAFTADSKRGAKIWNLQTGKEISQLSYIQRQRIFSTAIFSEDGTQLLTGSPSRRINLWSVESGKELNEWKVTPRKGSSPQTAVVYAVGFLENNQIISQSSAGLAEIWTIY